MVKKSAEGVEEAQIPTEAAMHIKTCVTAERRLKWSASLFTCTGGLSFLQDTCACPSMKAKSSETFVIISDA